MDPLITPLETILISTFIHLTDVVTIGLAVFLAISYNIRPLLSQLLLLLLYSTPRTGVYTEI